MSNEGQHKYDCDCGCMGAGPMFKDFLKAVLPSEEAGNHFRNARIEFLQGMRTYLDEKIEAMRQNQPQGTKVTVE